MPRTHSEGAMLDAMRPHDALRSGWPDFDAMTPLRAGRLTLLDVGGEIDLVESLYADAAVQGRAVVVADGGNTMDVYHLATAARRRARARLPQDAGSRDVAALADAALDRVRVARGFTVHQLQAIVEDGLAREAERAEAEGLPVGLVAAPRLLDMSLDADVARDEARALAERALAALRALARRLDAPVLVTSGLLTAGTQHALRALLEKAADEQVGAFGGAAALYLEFPRRGARFVTPRGGQRRIEEFDARVDEPLVAPAPRAAPMGASYMRGRLWGPRYAPAATFIHGPRALLEGSP